MRALLLAVVTVVIATLLGPVPAQAGEARLRDAVQRLRVASETNAGYDRDTFRHWVDANSDCQHTRTEVLDQESTVHVSGCSISRGRWVSYYDGRIWRRASDVDIDHLVPLAEAWGSGARGWNADTRRRFANDLTDRRALVAVTDNVNQAKGAMDPADWMPQRGKCRYVRDWVAVKLRWHLRVNRREKAKLVDLTSGCRNTVLRWKPASVVTRGTVTGSTTAAGVRITMVVYDPDGPDDDWKLNQERVRIKNVSGTKKNLSGWKLTDEVGHRYTFPGFALRAGEAVVVHSGHGSNGAHHLYAGWGWTWNNTGDTARLRNKAGTLADKCGWGDGSGVTYC